MFKVNEACLAGREICLGLRLLCLEQHAPLLAQLTHKAAGILHRRCKLSLCCLAELRQRFRRDTRHVAALRIHAAEALEEVHTCSKLASWCELRAARCAARPSKQRSSRSRFASSRTALQERSKYLASACLAQHSSYSELQLTIVQPCRVCRTPPCACAQAHPASSFREACQVFHANMNASKASMPGYAKNLAWSPAYVIKRSASRRSM